tara:strand:+ start:6311 stop:6805 length:495 start_codon:yes stop_codon:yes gene_type:complete
MVFHKKNYAIHALFEFTSVIQTIIHSLKFEYNPSAVDGLLPPCIDIPTADVIIPVPSHTSRIRQRGFDHIEVLFKPLYTHRYYPCIQRVKKTPSLYDKTASFREKILKNAFQCVPEYTYDFTGKSVLVVDDIYTSGSTIDAMVTCIKAHYTPACITAFALCRKL